MVRCPGYGRYVDRCNLHGAYHGIFRLMSLQVFGLESDPTGLGTEGLHVG